MGAKTFSTLAVASCATGVGLCDGLNYSLMMEISAHVLGFPVWTHELADKALMARVHLAIAAQFPKLPSVEAAHEDWKAAAAVAVNAYGPTVVVEEGTQERSEGPVDSLVRLTGRPEDIIAVVAE